MATTTMEGATTARQTAVRALALMLVIVLGAFVVHHVTTTRTSVKERAVPQSAAMEDALGIRISRVAVVGDGGLITMSYVVLDAV
jgi:branched-subunit amino acid ABC-type transport system permease component